MNLKELEDYSWFPKKLRQFQSEMIGFVVQKFGVYRKLSPVVEKLVKENKLHKIVDLCSGSGLPSVYISEHLTTTIPMELTDKFPPADKGIAGIYYQQNPVDVLQLKPDAGNLYTMYNAFHHFSTAEQKAILQNFGECRGSLLIAEILSPALPDFLKVVLVSTVGQWLLAPFIRPFSWLRLIFTYLLPVNILTVLTDGVLSVFKSKTQKQYAALCSSLQFANYRLETNTIHDFPNKIITILAQPIYVNP